MWRILHSFRREGYNFRRQVQLGTYYVDFACHAPAIVIEVDGDTHGSDIARSNDAVRDDYLSGRGYRVLRFWNNEVMVNPYGVHLIIAACLKEKSASSAPPTPAPLGRSASKLRYPPREGEGGID
jgi:very-short-patch-repair endonuclease